MFLRLKDRHCLQRASPSGFRSQPRIYAFVANKIPLRGVSLPAKMGEQAMAEKKREGEGMRRGGEPGSAKSHLKPPGSASSFEGRLEAKFYIRRRVHISPAALSLYIGIYRYVREGGFLSALAARDHYSVAVGCLWGCSRTENREDEDEAR